MAKYLFHELRTHKGDLPLDVNGPAEACALRFSDQDLTKMLSGIREKKLYGTAMHTDPNGRIVAEFDYQHGMCPRFKLVEYHGERSAFVRSIHNDNLSMRKDK